MNAKGWSLGIVLGGLYVSLGLLLAPISFGAVQCRVADALYPLIAFLGYPALIGLTIGQFILNLIGFQFGLALGWLDLASPLILLPFKWLIKEYGYTAVPFHVVGVGVWVSFLLWSVTGAPMIVTAPLIIVGEFLAECVMGIPLAKAVEKRMSNIKRFWDESLIQR
jgi:uncharacterized membrane protein